MTLTLRQLIRSRPLRALGALAWLLLVINTLAAAPLGMAAGNVSHNAPAAVAHAAPVPHASHAGRPCQL